MDYTEKIKDLEKELTELKEKQKIEGSLSPDKKLAELLHKKLCHGNHTDYCGWEYESWDNIGYSKQNYLDQAKKILKITDYDTAVKVIKCL